MCWQKIGGSWYFFEGERCNGSRYVDSRRMLPEVKRCDGCLGMVDYNRYYVDERGSGLLRAKKEQRRETAVVWL